jgi:hypothetical protein
MKEYTVYELEASDKLYHVTDDNKIEEITLTDDHFVEEFDDNFWCYLAHDKSHIIISKDNSNYYINQPKLRSKNGRVPVYSLHCEDYGRTRKVYLIEEKDIKVYAMRKSAEKEAAKRNLAEFKKEFFAKIRKAEIYDAISNRKLFTAQVKSAKAFDKFKKKVKELEKDGPVSTKIETLDGLTFTVEKLEANLQAKIAKFTDK